jgi:hypothetical protein
LDSFDTRLAGEGGGDADWVREEAEVEAMVMGYLEDPLADIISL